MGHKISILFLFAGTAMAQWTTVTAIDPTTEVCVPGDRRINTKAIPSREWRCDSSTGTTGSWRLMLDTSGTGPGSIMLIEGVPVAPTLGQSLYFDPATHHLSRKPVSGIVVDLEASGLSILGGTASWPSGLPYYVGKSGGGPPENVVGNNNWVPGKVYCYDTYDPYTLTPTAIAGVAGNYGRPAAIAIAVFDPSGNRLLSANLAWPGGGPGWAKWNVAGVAIPPGSHSWCIAFEPTLGVGLASMLSWSGNFSANSLDISAGISGAPMTLYSCSVGTTGAAATFAIPQFGNCTPGHGARAHVDASVTGIPALVVYQ